VHVDFIPAEVYHHYDPKVEVVADVSGTIWELNRRLSEESIVYDSEWYKPIREKILTDIAGYDLDDGDALTVPGALNIVRDVMDDCGLVISDVGSHKIWIARNFPTYCPNGCIISNGLASMGIALPGAVAASLVDPDRQIVAMMGDGGFMMNSQELETAKRLGANFTVLLFNDDDYGLISWKQNISRGRSVGTHIGNPDFKAYVESFGIDAYRPESVADLREQLGEALGSRKLNVVEVRVDAGVNVGLVNKLESYWEGRP